MSDIPNNFKIICTLPNASTEINGVPFEEKDGAMVAYNVPEDDAEKFSGIPGYEVIPQQGSGDSIPEDLGPGLEVTNFGAVEEVDTSKTSDGQGADVTEITTGDEENVDLDAVDGKPSASEKDSSMSDSAKDEAEVKLDEMKAKGLIEHLKVKPESWPEVLTLEETRSDSEQRKSVLEAVAFAKASLEDK